ncbi:hypothetical protein AB0I93_26865 [Streptomyces sp. NPDC049967]|uniref:hypothetical protein n=1 Tax=Streptomyces sp. NPDC049967 TaxID=3155658 RepID=UPI00341EDCAF
MDRIQTPITVALPMPERLVINYDDLGSYWGVDTVTATMTMIDGARKFGEHIDEWATTDRAGHPLRIVRIADPDFIDTICIIPTDSDPDLDKALRRARTGRPAVTR